MHTHRMSTATAASRDTDPATVVSSANTFVATDTTSPTIAPAQSDSEVKYDQRENCNMTIYYHYDSAGQLQGTSTEDPAVQRIPLQPDLSYFLERGDVVGVFLAQRALMQSAYPSFPGTMAGTPEGSSEPSWDDRSDTVQDAPLRHQYGNGYEPYQHPNDQYLGYTGTTGYAGFVAPSQYIHYPDPEDIRHLHTLHSLLPYLSPERKIKAIRGPCMDIVEQDTGNIFATKVPKKLLLLFLGQKVVTKFIRTIEREDNENWHGLPVKQDLYIPRGVGQYNAFRILISWMLRACGHDTMGSMRQFRVPKNMLTAFALSEILRLFGLHRDVLRVDNIIAKEHFTDPIFAVELEAMWRCLGENSRFVYAAIKKVGERLREYEGGAKRRHTMWNETLELLEKYPPLKARVRDLELNEKYQPVFGTEWCKDLGGDEGYPKKFAGYRRRWIQQRRSGDQYFVGRMDGTEKEASTTASSPEAPAKPPPKAAILRIVW